MGVTLLDGVDLETVGVLEVDPPEEFDPDPEPAAPTGRARRRKIRDAVKPTGQHVSVTTRKRLVVELEAYAELAALSVIVRDPVCGEVIHGQAKPVAEALASILARYPDLAAKILGTGAIGDWLKLLMAVKPIAQVVWSHHFLRPVDSGEGVTDVRDSVSVGDPNLYPAWRPAR